MDKVNRLYNLLLRNVQGLQRGNMKILGIHDGHNSSACYIENGVIKFACQEERFTYVKNQGGMPIKTIEYIKNKFEIKNFDEVILSNLYMGNYDWSRENIIKSYQHSDSIKNIFKQYIKRNNFFFWLYKKKSNIKRSKIIEELFPNQRVAFLDHHLSHASAAYYGYGAIKNKQLVITCDGSGDGFCASVNVGENGKLSNILNIEEQHSIGRVYSYFTYLFNMVPYEHEYKIMGLAPYCSDINRINIAKKKLFKLFQFVDDDTHWRYIGKYPSIQSAGKELKAIFYETRFDILSAAIQEFIEEMLCKWIYGLIKKTSINNVILSGGIFMNVKANMLIAKLKNINSIYVLPSCSDDTNAIGAAFYRYYQKNNNMPKKISNFYLGGSCIEESNDIDKIKSSGFKYKKYKGIEEKIAMLLSQGKIVGRIQGNMEFGARSLGNRAILANPSIDGVLKTINQMIKGRDFWMPFAPSVLYEDIEKYFHLDTNVQNYEYMIFTVESKSKKRNYAKSALHPYDFTGRPQSVRKEQNPNFHRLLTHYKKLTGESLILNTSYNLHGYPMVRTIEQVLDVFSKSSLKYLAVEEYLLQK